MNGFNVLKEFHGKLNFGLKENTMQICLLNYYLIIAEI